MENMENQNEINHEGERGTAESGNGWIWVIGLIVVVVVGVWLWQGGATVPSDNSTSTDQQATTSDQMDQPPEARADQSTSTGATSSDPQLGEDSVEDIEQQLEGINIEDIEGEFQNIDEDLQNLESTTTGN